MNRDAQDNLTLLVGATMLTVGVSDLHLRYVKPQMQPLLVLSGLVLLAFGVRGLRRMYTEAMAQRAATRGRTPAPVTPTADAHHHPHLGLDAEPLGPGAEVGHEHDHAPTRTAWLLALPLLVLALVAPPSLGAYAAARSDTKISEPTFDLPELPAPRDGAVDLTLTDYYTRVLYDADSLQGARVRLTGFVTPADGRWYVTRMALACCAADGRPVKVLTAGAAAADAPASDAWVEVVGTFTAPQSPAEGKLAVATLDVESVRPTAAPANPYE